MESFFEKMNEADVREEIITPLLHRLGYKSGTRNNIVRELSLRYPKVSLGRKNPGRDLELRGKADYILEVEGRLLWVLEAKSPAAPISPDDVEQAWTYAKHQEVRAIFFALCNGRKLMVYRTDYAADASPVLSLDYDFERDFRKLENLLAPEALLREFPETRLDVGVPIAPRLRSLARITGGTLSLRNSSLGAPVVQELQWTVSGGSVQRDESQRLIAFITTTSPRSLFAGI